MEEAFVRALERINLRLKEHPGLRFTVILNGQKKPEGKKWTTDANYAYGDGVLAGYLAEGHNYGVCTGIADLVVLDADDLPRLDALNVTPRLPETFKVRTGRGGQHAYLFCPGLRDRVVLEDPELKDGEGDPLHLGEIQALGQQAVGPGSIHPNGNRYEVINDAPIASISKEALLAIIKPLKIKSDAQDRETRITRSSARPGGALGDLIPIEAVTWPKDIKERCGSEVRGSHPSHGSDSGKNFSVNTSKNCWHCFRHKTGGGPLEWLAVDAGLIRCEDAKPECFDKETFKKVLKIAKEKGFDIPLPESRRRKGKQDGQVKQDKPTQVDVMIQVALDTAELWHTPDKVSYITIPQGKHKETYLLRSKATRNWLSYQFYLESSSESGEGRAAGSQALEDCLNVLEGKALFAGDELPVYVRVAPYEDKIYVDLGESKWQAIEITANGWAIISDPPVKFRRPKSMKALPMPVAGGSWDDFRAIQNVDDDDEWILRVSWLVQAYWPAGPYTHLFLTGEQGSAKSKLMSMLKTAVDPSTADVRRPPKDEVDLVIAAQSERILGYDNLSSLAKEMSDALCCLSTGAALGTRRLYTNDEEAVMNAKRPCILNGIDSIVTRPDLLDRIIINNPVSIPENKRRTEKDLDAAFEKLRPGILGLVLDATVCGLKNIGNVVISEYPRMADFTAWVVACEMALPWAPGQFLEVYKRSRREAMTALFETDRFAQAVYNLALGTPGKTYTATAADLLSTLNIREHIYSDHVPTGWPKSANKIRGRLNRVSPQLRAVGCTWSAEVTEKGTRYRIRIDPQTELPFCTTGDKNLSPVYHQSYHQPKTGSTLSELTVENPPPGDHEDTLSLSSKMKEKEEKGEKKEKGEEEGKGILSPVSSLSSGNDSSMPVSRMVIELLPPANPLKPGTAEAGDTLESPDEKNQRLKKELAAAKKRHEEIENQIDAELEAAKLRREEKEAHFNVVARGGR